MVKIWKLFCSKICIRSSKLAYRISFKKISYERFPNFDHLPVNGQILETIYFL